MDERYPGLEMELDERFQRREWRVERVAWGVMGAIIIGAVAGVFGGGPVSRGRAGDVEAGVIVEFDRFARREAPITLRLVVQPSLIDRDRVQISFNRDFMDQHRVQAITPTPVASGATDDGVEYLFAADPQRPLIVTMNLHPIHAGTHQATVSVDEKASVLFSTFVYP